ncbi:MAG TPA: DsbA family oxidoreductase [Casimicrobiaceae bacterium]|nr:DsbA family oxidoreductase [Casimicrobiaceae bacterium]
MKIDIVSDVVCPWCYIGKRRLERALATLRDSEPALDVTLRWHPFQLNPDLPRTGIDRQSYLNAKFGGPSRAEPIYERVREAGRESGLALAFDRIERQPNTLDAHRLIAWAQRENPARADDLVERLFHAYFVEGAFVGDADTLAALAADAGYDHDGAAAMLASDALRDDVAAADERARSLGIQGVPFFVFDGRVAVSGAHEPATLLDAIAKARAPVT